MSKHSAAYKAGLDTGKFKAAIAAKTADMRQKAARARNRAVTNLLVGGLPSRPPLSAAVFGRAATGQVPRGFAGQAGEAKYIDIANQVYGLDTTGTITHVSVVPQGTTVNSRVGRKCELKYFQMRGDMRALATADHNSVAVYLVWDEQPNKALAAITDVLDAANSYALSKRENVQRFKILKKWSYTLCGNSATLMSSNAALRLDEYVRLPKGLVVVPTTADTTGVIGDIITGALLLITVGDHAAGGTTCANMQVTCRTGFSDIY